MGGAAGGAAAAAAASAAAIAQAIKASGAIVQVEPKDFTTIVNRADRPVVVTATGGLFTKYYQYLTSYRGLAFFTRSREPLLLTSKAEIITAGKIWIPG